MALEASEYACARVAISATRVQTNATLGGPHSPPIPEENYTHVNK